ncbi:EF-hand calcium-binding domain-containing protein 13 isoform X1 [Pseudorca crassidens]|uniref:EF-hand calcium-binding domain-containing protein 13 isoform X1 n=1 Tax=Pseudorca crassidens TaxID=82174 RepID=UPI00352EC411
MSAPDLWNTLSSLKSNLKKDEFLAALKLATVDGEKVDTSDLEIFLQNMGIELTEDKGMELLNNLPVDAKRKVYMNRLMKELQSFKGTKVSLDKVDTFIKNMGIDLKEKEIQELKDHLPVDEHRLRTRRLSGHGSRAQPLRGMWDLPGPGHEPVYPASTGRLSTTAPPGKPYF